MSFSNEKDDVQLDVMLEELGHYVDELSERLDIFQADRYLALQRQKQAIANYDKEMQDIDDMEYFGAQKWAAMTDQSKPVVDHNILKHLSIDKQQEYHDDGDKFEKEKTHTLDYQSMISDLKKKKIPDIAQENLPPPSFDEKRKRREDMFNFFEESTIEETRLEIEIDKAKDQGDQSLVDELSDALFLLQKLHGEKLSGMIAGYKPQLFSKSWGSDPDYVKLSRELNGIAEAYNTTDLELNFRK